MELTKDQQEDYKRLKLLIENDIKTEPAFTKDDVENILKVLKKTKNIDLYHFLRRRSPTAVAVKKIIDGMKQK